MSDVEIFSPAAVRLSPACVSVWPAVVVRLGPVGMALGRVKTKLKTAKRAMLTRRSETRLAPSRGTGRPKKTYCFGIIVDSKVPRAFSVDCGVVTLVRLVELGLGK